MNHQGPFPTLRKCVLAIAVTLAAMLFVAAAATAQVPDASAQLQKAARAIESGNTVGAEQIVQRVLKSQPQQPVALTLLGVIRARAGKEDEAEELFQRVIRANPRFPMAYDNLGVMYGKRGEVERAGEMLQRAVDLAPKDGTIRYHFAALLTARGDFLSAITQMLAIPPASRPGDYWSQLAGFYLSQGSFEEGENCLKRELAKHPDSVETLRQLAGVALKRNNAEAAWKYIAQARSLAPNSPQLLYEYAQISRSNNSAREAVLALRRALLLDPDRPEYLQLLGNSLLSTPSEEHYALPYLERYVALRPDDPLGHLSLGTAYWAERDFVRARAEAERAAALDPTRTDGDLLLGLVAYESGDTARAIETLSRYVKNYPDNYLGQMNLGMALMHDGHLQEARGPLEEAKRLNPDEPKVHYQLSQLWARLGDAAAAQRERQLYQQFQQMPPKQPPVPSAPARNTGP